MDYRHFQAISNQNYLYSKEPLPFAIIAEEENEFNNNEEYSDGDSIDGNFSLSDESIIAYDAGLFDYTYELCNNLKSCELTIVDNGNDTHTCICSFERGDESFFFSTIITYESSIGESETVTITDYVLDDYCIEDSIIYLFVNN